MRMQPSRRFLRSFTASLIPLTRGWLYYLGPSGLRSRCSVRAAGRLMGSSLGGNKSRFPTENRPRPHPFELPPPSNEGDLTPVRVRRRSFRESTCYPIMGYRRVAKLIQSGNREPDLKIS